MHKAPVYTTDRVVIRQLGLQPYLNVWENMKAFTSARTDETADELWLLEHPAVYTLGQAGKTNHILNPSAIPIRQTDRGGQVTYHGPGQLVAYVLLDLRRRNLSIKALVTRLEESLISLLALYKIQAGTKPGAPGVYVEGKKIASIGLRVRHGCTYHGIALNVAMDLTPFDNINPCGFAQLKMTQISDYVQNVTVSSVSQQFEKMFLTHFEY